MLSLLAAVLTGAAVAALVTAFSATLENEGTAFSALFRFVVIPMTLFSGTFFPVDRLPGWMQPRGLGLPAVARHRARPRRRARTLAAAGRARPPRLPARRCWRVGVALAARLFTRRLQPMTAVDEPTSTSPSGAAAALVLRLLPAGSYAGRSRALLLRSATASRRAWLAFVSGFFEPVFYLFAMGQGLGSLVGTLPGPGRRARSATPRSSRPACWPRRR